MLYAITEAGLEIYTARGAAAAIHEITEFDGITNVSPITNSNVGLAVYLLILPSNYVVVPRL